MNAGSKKLPAFILYSISSSHPFHARVEPFFQILHLVLITAPYIILFVL